MKENKLEELIEHHKHAKQEAWSLANELYSTDSTNMSEEQKRALREAKLSMDSEYSYRCLFISDLENLRE